MTSVKDMYDKNVEFYEFLKGEVKDEITKQLHGDFIRPLVQVETMHQLISLVKNYNELSYKIINVEEEFENRIKEIERRLEIVEGVRLTLPDVLRRIEKIEEELNAINDYLQVLPAPVWRKIVELHCEQIRKDEEI